METPEIIRKIRYRQGSFAVNIPKKIATALDIRQNRYAGLRVADGGLYIRIIPPDDDYMPENDAESDSQYTWNDTDHADDTSQLDGLRM